MASSSSRTRPSPPFHTVASAGPHDAVPVGPDAPIMDVLRTTRAMRRLKPDPVPRDLLERLVESATWAPSGRNTQQYSYVVVTEPAQMARLAPLWREVQSKYMAVARLAYRAGQDPAMAAVLRSIEHQARHFEQTPAVVAVCYRRPPTPRSPKLFVDLVRLVGPRFVRRLVSARAAVLNEASSTYLGVQNLLLAARAHGLAANISTWHLFAENEFKAVLGVPKDVTIYALIPIGWPEGRFGPVRRRPVAEVLHWDRW